MGNNYYKKKNISLDGRFLSEYLFKFSLYSFTFLINLMFNQINIFQLQVESKMKVLEI